MANEYPGVIPMLSYENCVAALDWLARAFGLRERARIPEPDGRIGHAEMETDQGVIMLASGPAGYESPATRSKRYERIREWLAVVWAFLRLKMRLTVVSIAQRIWKAIAGCSCSAPSGKGENADALMSPRIPLAAT